MNRDEDVEENIEEGWVSREHKEMIMRRKGEILGYLKEQGSKGAEILDIDDEFYGEINLFEIDFIIGELVKEKLIASRKVGNFSRYYSIEHMVCRSILHSK